MPEPRVHFWCTGEAGRQPVSFFCKGDLANPTSVLICSDAFAARQMSASLICEGL
jgi:hypothetical protein